MKLTKPCARKPLSILFALIFLTAISNNVKSQVGYYVKQSATGLNNGSSWANAFTSLATAFSLINTGDTIRVAKGIYTPGTNVLNSFQLKDSVIIMGGYPDTGNPTDANRNFGDYQSIMSGEIGVPNNSLDNIKIILQAINVKGFVVDGFVIEKGHAGGSTELGPIYFTGATGIIDHSVIRNNYNYWGGAAINTINTTATLSNTFIENNATETGNGTGSVFSLSSTSNIKLINTVVAKNKTRLLINQSYSTTQLVNCTVFKNYGFSSIHDTSSMTVQNSIFYRNGNNYNVDTAEFIKDVYSAITISNTITEVYNFAGSGFLGVDPKFTDTANVAGVDGKYFTTDDGLRLLNPCSPAINAGNNSFVTGINSDIAGATRIKNAIVDLGAYEVQEAIVIAPSVIYVKKNATGLNNGTSWQNAFTDLQSAFNICSDTIKVAKGIYPVSASDPRASYTLSNNRVIIGGYPDFGSPTNNDINTELYPSTLNGMINSNLKCYNIVLSNNNDSTARLIGFEITNSASPDFYYFNNATVKIIRKSSPYLEKIKLSSLTNQAQYLLYIADLSKPKFYNCAFYNGFTSAGSLDGARTIYIRNNSEPQFVDSYIGKDTTAATTPDFGAKFLFDGTGGTIDNCIFFRAAHNAVTNQNSNTLIQNSSFTKTVGRSISNISSLPVITNCVFRDTANNNNNFNGGAISNNSNSTALIDKCRFYNSFAYYFGGAIANENSSTTVKNSIFRNCGAAQGGGGALYNNAGMLKLINCTGYLNGTVGSSSIATGQFLIAKGGSTSSIINSTIISDNIRIHPIIQTSSTADTLKLYNSIIWRYGTGYPISLNENDVLTANNNNAVICDIRNSILFKQTNTILTNSSTRINPRLIDLSNPEGFDRLFYSADDGLNLCTCSPAINAGNNSLNPEVSDILGANRVYNGTIDIGAYELPENPTTGKTFFVKENAAPGGNGVTWANAYNSLQKAVLNNCADTIKISKGKYVPSLVTRDSSFNIYRGVAILGGYPDSGNPTDQDRNFVINPTILSGDIGVLNDSTDNTANILRIHCPDTTVLIDGLIIERGNANLVVVNQPASNYQTTRGGGIFARSNNLLLINRCTLRNNYGLYGGGLYFEGTAIDINKSEFSNNNAQEGGGFYSWDVYGQPNTNPNGVPVTIRNSVFSTNRGTAGTIMENSAFSGATNYRLENLIVYKNENNLGAGFRFRLQPVVTLINCIFAKNNNTASNAGVGIYVDNTFSSNFLNTKVHNTIFVGNTVMGATPSVTNSDFNWKNASNQTETIPFGNFNYSARSANQTGSGQGLISNAAVSLIDINNGPGPDNLWMTVDDGLRPTNCSNTLDKGSNTYVQNIPLDILDTVRILNSIVDMGPYELGNSGAATPTAAITASDTTICTGTQVTFNATVSGANLNTVYQWMINSSNVGTNGPVFVTNTLANNDTVKVVITINNPCVNTQTVTSNSIVIQVSPAFTSSVSISSSANPSCVGNQVLYTAVPVNGGQSPNYQWKKNGINAGTNSPTYIPSPINNNDVIIVVMTSSLTCVTSNPVNSNSITQIVDPILTASVSVTSTPIGCPGSSISFTANPVNGGSVPSYQWKVNGGNVGTNSPAYISSTLNENDVVTVVMTSSLSCVTTTVVTSPSLVVHYAASVTPSVGITSTPMGCVGASISFTANPVNGGTTPVYQWKLNNTNVGTNSSTFTSSTLNNNDVVKVIMHSSNSCAVPDSAISNGITITFTTGTTAYAGNDTSICAGSSVQLQGSGGTTYSWSPAAGLSNPNIANPVATPVSTTAYILTVSNGPACFANDTILITVNPAMAPAVTISASANNICSGTLVTFTATPANGGATPNYQWQVNGTNAGTNSNTFTSSALLNNSQVKIILISSLACAAPATATSNIITMAVTATPIANAGPDVTICNGSGTQINGSGGTTYSWSPATGLSNPNIANPVASPAATTTYVLTVSNGPSCSSTDMVIVTVGGASITPTAVISTASSNICEGSAATFNASITNGGANPIYQWQVNGINAGINSSSFTYSTFNNNDQVKLILTSSLTCATTTTVTSNIITISTTQLATPLISVSNRVFTVSNPDVLAVYIWQVKNGNVWADVIPASTGTVYTATVAGEYKVKAVKGACTQYSASTVANFSTLYSHFIDLYPNPAHNYITLDSIALVKKYETVEIIDMLTKRVLPLFSVINRTTITIDISMLSNGVYMAIIRQKDGTYSAIKFIKQ